MKPKKNNRADLENGRQINFIVGLLISASLILISFEWTRPVNLIKDLHPVQDITAEVDLIEIIPRERPENEPPRRPEVKTVIIPVPDDIELPPLEWDNIEVDRKTSMKNWLFEQPEELPEEPQIWYFPQEPASFNGGSAETEFGRYIYGKLRYPEEALDNGVDGLVILQFDVDPAGFLVNAKILKGVHPSLDNEALRVVQASPRWTPAMQGGKAVTMRFTFPVRFVLK